MQNGDDLGYAQNGYIVGMKVYPELSLCCAAAVPHGAATILLSRYGGAKQTDPGESAAGRYSYDQKKYKKIENCRCY